MYNYTNGSSEWESRVQQVLSSTFSLFFPTDYGGNVMTEMECEPKLNCDQDQKSFKAYLSRWLAVTALLVPSTASQIMPKLQASAMGAAGQCSGGGEICGEQWYTTTYDGLTGVGEEVRSNHSTVIGE
jgi:mannan endo-1,6-alpha-mannosidase